MFELQFAPAEELRVVNAGAGIAAVTEKVQSYGDKYYGLRAFCMYDKVIVFDENNCSICAEY